ncbi:mitochondrial distribution and morphology protein family 31/32 [Boletus edulis BED1]|uniref:Mitochondrial distribution and morphology protein family 31/32 n=1 Tax=Boletus edulis BED1 TaxID=1328754 RepID=A0AAD4C0H4_BOLED|nr:mitochondrial distribution and morphology protein family 31/32 [Boletus edulis BED1]
MLRSALVRHTTRGVLHPTVDRYIAIRRFFIGLPHSTHPRPAVRNNVRFNHLDAKQKVTPPRPDNVEQKPAEQHPHLPPLNLDDYPRLYRRLALSLSHLHRPTRDDFLKVANGFWQRLRIRFKWFTIRSFRKFNADDISAFITWFLMSQTLWIFVGTTTFFSVIFATANSLRLQESVAKAISNYLTGETGVTVIFESAIVPKWKDSRISFKNVYISRRPQTVRSTQKKRNSLEHKAAVAYDVSSHPAYNYTVEEDEEVPQSHADDDTNYSMFDLNIDSIDVTLSLTRWLDGKGLVEDAVVKGVRGILDRRSVLWDPENPLDPAAFRSLARPGDFELHSLQLEDVLVTVYQPGNFRPYTASIFRADMRTLRKQWLFYDFLRAENVVGQFDNCLFSLHKPQSIGRTTEQDVQDGKWSRMTRIRIDGVNIDHMQNSTTDPTGPLSWITSGKVDAVLDIKFPCYPEDEYPFNALFEELADAISTASASLNLDRIPGQRELAKPPLVAPTTDLGEDEPDKPRVVIDIDLRFRDVKAAVPLFTQNLSYVNNALTRPIVAFMNAHHTLVPIHCRVVKDVGDFDGAWTMWETGLMDEISQKVYDALAYHVSQTNMNRRVKAVGVWSLQMTATAILSALRNIVDPMASRLREVYYVDGIPYDALLLFIA